MSLTCRMRGEKWVAPTADNPVDIALLKTLDLSTVKLKCHCCGKDAFRRNPGDSNTPLLSPNPWSRPFHLYRLSSNRAEKWETQAGTWQ